MTVFVVQQQMQFSSESQELIPRFPSINKAESWGVLKFILSPSAHPFNPEIVLGDMHEALSGFSDDDYLLLIGNPILIGMATTLAAYYNNGKVNFLQWSGKHQRYTMISAQIH